MRQLIIGSGLISTGGIYYCGLMGGDGPNFGAWTTDINRICTPWSVAGTFRKLRVKVTTAPGAGDSYTFTVYVNGLSALTLTISNTDVEGADLSNSVTVAAGDHVYLYRSSTGLDASGETKWSLEFESNVACESGYHSWSVGAIFGGNTYHAAPFGLFAAVTTSTQSVSLVAMNGAITRYDVRLSIAAGAGESNFFVLYKNGVAQDGSGGTPDTRLTVGNTTTGSKTGFSLTITPGDLIQYQVTQSASAASTFIGISTKVVATTNGYSQLTIHNASSATPTGATNYIRFQSTSLLAWTTTEATAAQTLDGAWWANNLQIYASGPPGAGKSFTFDVRVNSASPANTPTAVITGTSTPTTGADTDPTHIAVFTNGDTIDLRSVPSGTPTAPQILIALGMIDPQALALLTHPGMTARMKEMTGGFPA